MNLILLEPQDFASETRVHLAGRRGRHIARVHRASVGDDLVVGRLDGWLGRGRVVSIDAERVVLEVVLDTPPPGPLGIDLVLALPRPPMLRRLLAGVTAMGVKRIALVDARAVERSFWQSRALDPEAIREQLMLGLEQGRDTVRPEVALHRRLEPFLEDVLPGWLAERTGYIAHPAPEVTKPVASGGGPALLAVGPEGGWSDDEVERFRALGLHRLGLGERPLRVEVAVPALLARLM